MFALASSKIAMLDATTGEIIERRLEHDSGVAERFYATLSGPARVGIEATINTRWFERMLGRYGHELWIGDAVAVAKVALARKLAVRLYWRLRAAAQPQTVGSHAG
jgi:hypothetical protein